VAAFGREPLVIQFSTLRARLGLASATMLALVAFSAGPVAADTGPVGDGTFTQNGTSAYLSSGGCLSNDDGTTTCSQTELSVFVGKMSDNVSGVTHSRQVCFFTADVTYDDETGEYVDGFGYEAGCVEDISSKSLVVGTKLSTLTLAPTTISIQRITCEDKGEECEFGAIRDVTVSGTWTGLGQVYSSKDRSRGDDGYCRYSQSFSGSSREASFQGSVDGRSAADDSWASLQDGKMTFRSRCVEV
jgi:hypothetical protein